MTALLIAHGSDMLPVDATGTEFPHQKTTPDSSSTEHKYSTRDKRSQSAIDTLQVIENRQENLLARSLDTSLDAGKYVKQMRFIQDILNEEVVLQRNERDMLAKKYRASVNSFRQGILREKIAALAARQKTLLTMVNRQKDVAQKITEYKQSKAPNAINGASSSLCNPSTSPARNQISALCTVSKGLGANRTNGRTMATTVSACSTAPDSENIQFHHSSPSPIGYLGMNSVEDDFTNVTESEKGLENDSQCEEFNENSMEIVDDFLSLNLCCDITPPDLSDTINNQSDCMAPGNKTPNSICIGSSINVTGTYNKDINRADLQQSLRRCHSSCASLDSHIKNAGVNIQGNSVTNYDNYQQVINRSGLSDQSLSVQSTPKQQIASKAEKSMRRVPIGELLKKGKIKPGQDVLEFHLQGNMYKASLLNDGRIRDGSGTIYRGPVQWVKALLGNEIAVTCKYVMTKVLYSGKNLSTFITEEEDFSLKEARVTPPHEENIESSSLLVTVPKSSPNFLKIKDILLITKKDFLPIHVADERWKQFMEGDSWTA
uniref:RAMA domain-containing protein n=1 Tax=Leptobrachium leishanense TaxID=445787 RepID=A0A8C5QGW9_9ANUR